VEQLEPVPAGPVQGPHAAERGPIKWACSDDRHKWRRWRWQHCHCSWNRRWGWWWRFGSRLHIVDAWRERCLTSRVLGWCWIGSRCERCLILGGHRWRSCLCARLRNHGGDPMAEEIFAQLACSANDGHRCCRHGRT
jgi:hypothetical protein